MSRPLLGATKRIKRDYRTDDFIHGLILAESERQGISQTEALARLVEAGSNCNGCIECKKRQG